MICIFLSTHIYIFIFEDLFNLRLMSVAYFLYLFLFSGLEYSLTFLVHQRFNYTRYLHVYLDLSPAPF